YWLCALNPFTHAVELVRNALYLRLHLDALLICCGLTVLLTVLAVASFNPQHAALRKAGRARPRANAGAGRAAGSAGISTTLVLVFLSNVEFPSLRPWPVIPLQQ